MQTKYMMILLCGGMLFAGTGCKNTNKPDEPTNKMVQTRHLTIKMSDAAGAPIRHMPAATITDEGSTLSAEWKAGDEATYCNLSRQNGNDAITGTLTATGSGAKSDLIGDVTCTAEDYLAVVYPATNTFAYNDPGNSYTYTFSLSGQDGTLATLASSYHQVFGRARVISVSETTAEATMDPMESLLTVCKFSFEDKTNPATALPINTLSISYGGAGSDVDTYPQSATVTVTSLTTNTEASAVGVAGSTPLTINAAGATEVYVALLPTAASRTYNFTVTNNEGTYTGTADAHLIKGEFVPATGLKLQQ